MKLADTSAWTVAPRVGGEVWSEFAASIMVGDIAMCAPVQVELLYSTRDGDQFAQLEFELASYPWLDIDATTWARAFDVFRALAQQGPLHHRSVGFNDLLVAATAELANVTVLHYDSDFDRIAKITGQRSEWIVPRGSV